MPNIISIGLKTWKLLRCHCSYHCKQITIVMRYFANAYCPYVALYQIGYQYCGCHDNIVIKAVRYVANVHCPKEALY